MTLSPAEAEVLARLIYGQRWAALASQADGFPNAAMVAYVAEPGVSGLLLLISRLSKHTQQLLGDARACLLISEADSGEGDPQTLARVAISGECLAVPRDHGDYAVARQRYCARLPASSRLFGFGDFELLRLVPREARFVAGFGRALTLDAARLGQIAMP
jgi:putative heme iron utilization protein